MAPVRYRSSGLTRQPRQVTGEPGSVSSCRSPSRNLSSGGQRRRLDVALALIGDPELVFLDEPTTGFDPSARRAAWDLIAGLRDLGKTIFLTTHYLEEAEYLADRIAVIVAGRIVAQAPRPTSADVPRKGRRSSSRCR